MPTFAQTLRRSGYLTSVTGKWQLATLQVHPTHIRDSGFDSWCTWQIWRDGAKTGRHWNATFNEDGKVRDDIADRFGPDVLTDYVIEQMREATEAEKPFLIVHNELLPHEPIVKTPDDRRSGRDASLGNMITYMDKLAGRVLDAVVELGIRDDTYVIFMGDNGTYQSDFKNPLIGRPGERPHTRHTTAGRVNGGKFQLNDAGTHVPMIVWGPKSIPGGSVCNELVDVVDLFPTFCELAGVEISELSKIDGHSLVPQFHGQRGRGRPWVIHGIGAEINVFDGQWRYFRNTKQVWDARDLPNERKLPQEESASHEAATILRQALQSANQSAVAPTE